MDQRVPCGHYRFRNNNGPYCLARRYTYGGSDDEVGLVVQGREVGYQRPSRCFLPRCGRRQL
ncbi:uncharacterized protein MYCFIDRAFT_173322 [Pseudocercospora fijiensis CIRAD86]|uniref:Uncharacterized protein n=1 Tax=Pseudocercospora fijiensis (strain CIRAD86) TaxID=383855 RepID=M2ZZH6_PSEFD|nr:uncharacterized protein MYCFIDRAFT_173322 [Pseudocercospora fijiensis CIRAD86]EME84309.1 hypothetical protein MYCFIDRAFT_173322 [Pseudocercospora fijiensis CIRAD86]